MASGKRAPATLQSTPVPETPRSGRQAVDRSVSPGDGRQARRRRPEKSRTREERNEEEIRFNLGYPKNMRLQTPTRTQRSGRSGRDVTDFPPPAYEAASPAPMSIQLQNTSTLALPFHPLMTRSPTLRSDVSLSPCPPANALRSPSPFPPSMRVQSEAGTETEPEVASPELLGIDSSARWEGDRKRGLNLNQRVAREFERQKQRVVPSESPATSPQPTRHNSFNIGRNATRVNSRLSLQIGVDQRVRALGVLESPTGSVSETPSRRQAMKSLSPSRLFQPQDRTQPPNPSASMISLLRPVNPLFKNPPSVLSPISSRNGTKGIQANKHVPRKLFHIRSGTKHEELHEWEVLEPDNSDDEEAYDQQVENSRSAQNAHIKRQMSTRSTVSTPRLASVATTELRPCIDEGDAEADQALITTPRQTPSSPFLTRNVRRMSPLVNPSSSAPNSPTLPSFLHTSTNESIASPKLTHGLLTESPVSDKQSPPQNLASSPASLLPAPTLRVREEILVSTHRTLQSPTPSVTHVDYDAVTAPVTTPVVPPAIPLAVQPGIPSNPRNPVPRSASRQNSLDKPLPPVRNMQGRFTDTYSIAIPADSAPPYTPSVTSTPTTIRGGHYPWRPLPQPPQTPRLSPISCSPSPVDSDIFTSAQPSPVITQVRQVEVPEGLLIDLNDDGDQLAGSHTNVVEQNLISLDDDDEAELYEPSDDGTSINDIATLASGPFPNSPQFMTPSNRSTESLSLMDSPIGAQLEYTDLNAVLTQVRDQQRSDGSDYEALLHIAEIIGPANPQHRSVDDILTSCLVGEVELVRRRVTKDGRIKLKLSLLGVNVNGCTICLSQFKEKERAILGAECQHAFHEKCLKNWLARNGTCPLCRKRLDAGD